MINTTDKPVLVFDGVCNLCNGWVNYIIDHDPEAHIRFAPLQSQAGKKLLDAYGRDQNKLDSVVLLDRGQVYEQSDAVLQLVRYLQGSAKLLRVGVIIPWFLRDLLYRLVARKRYRWFGRRNQCRVPEPGVTNRFLEMSDQTNEGEENMD